MARVRVWLALLAAAVAGAGMGAVLSLSLPDAGAIDTVSMEQTVVGEPVPDPDDPVPSPEVSDHEHVAHQTTSAEPSPEATPAPPPPPADVEQDQAETSSDRPPPGAPSPSGPLGIPERLLLAYRAAAAGYGQWCGLSWQVVAAVGQVESGHARGGQVYPDGQTWEPILGPVLDGSGFAAVPDSDDGVLDGDPVWDRAVGPMQFLPRTWAWLGADADRDGRADPHDVDDAAATTARYLCSHGGDLSDVGQLRSALLRYNASAAYVDTVLAWAEAYGDRAVATADPEPPAEPTPTPTATPTPSPSPTPTEELTPTPSPSPTPTEEPTPTPTEEPTPTSSPSPTPTEEPTPTPTEEPTPAPTEEPTPAPTLEATSMTGSTSTPG